MTESNQPISVILSFGNSEMEGEERRLQQVLQRVTTFLKCFKGREQEWRIGCISCTYHRTCVPHTPAYIGDGVHTPVQLTCWSGILASVRPSLEQGLRRGSFLGYTRSKVSMNDQVVRRQQLSGFRVELESD